MSYDTVRQVNQHLNRANYRHQEMAKNDICSALQHYRGLQPQLKSFTFNDGTTKNLVSLSGTIPVPYKGVNYNIPVAFWVLDTHPYHAPMVYVTPTADMQIKVSRHVDHTGKVYLPYLHEWSQGSSDLLGLIQVCIITFSEQSPVYARGPAVPQQQRQPDPPSMMPMPQPPGGGLNNLPSYSNHESNNNPPARPPPPQNLNSQNSTTSSNGTIDENHIKMSLLSAVEDKLRRVLNEEYETKRVEVESLRKVKEELEDKRRKLEGSLEGMDMEMKMLQSETAQMESAAASLAEQKAKLGENDSIDVDRLVDVSFPLHGQIFRAHAEDSAIDDALYYLMDALRGGVIDCEVFLKSVRNVSRKQFSQRFIIQKAKEKGNLA